MENKSYDGGRDGLKERGGERERMRSEICASDRGEKELRHLVGSVIEGEWIGKVVSGNRGRETENWIK